MNIVTLKSVVEINPRLKGDINPDSPVSFLPMANISEKGYISEVDERNFSDVSKGYTYFEEGDILLAKITPCLENGKAALAKDLPYRVGFGSTEFHVLRPDKSLAPKYLFYMLWNDVFRELAKKNMTGSAGQKRLPVRFLEQYQIPLPPLEEQKRIAAILDKADAIRRKRAQALQLTDQFLQSVFLDMFGDPVTNPKGWKKVSLEDVAEIITGYPFRSEDYISSEDGVKLCRGANVLPKRIDWSDLARWPKEQSEALLKTFDLKPNDIVLAMDRPWISEGFKIAQIQEEDCPSLLVQRVARIRGMNGVSNDFLFYLLCHAAFERHTLCQ